MLKWWHNFLYDPGTFIGTIALIVVTIAVGVFSYSVWKAFKS